MKRHDCYPNSISWIGLLLVYYVSVLVLDVTVTFFVLIQVLARSTLVKKADFASLENKCSCVEVAMSASSDDSLRQFLSREELRMMDRKLHEINEIAAQNQKRRNTIDEENVIAKRVFEEEKARKADQRKRDYFSLVESIKENRSEFLKQQKALFDRDFTEPARIRNQNRTLLACLEYQARLFDPLHSSRDIVLGNLQILVNEMEGQTVANHDIALCPNCSCAALNSRFLLDTEEKFTTIQIPTIVCPIKFVSMLAKDFTESFQDALKSSLSVVASVRRKKLKEVEFSKDFKSPLADAGVTRTDIHFGIPIETIPSMYAQKELGLMPTLEIPITIFVDANVSQECLKRVIEAIEWGRLKTLMMEFGHEVSIDFQKRPVLTCTEKFRPSDISSNDTALLQRYRQTWNQYLLRYDSEWKIPKETWFAMQERFNAATEKENLRRLEIKRITARNEFEEEIQRVNSTNAKKLEKYYQKLKRKQAQERAVMIQKILEKYEQEKLEADERFRSAYAQAMKHNARIVHENQRVRSESKLLAEQKALVSKIVTSERERCEQRKKLLSSRSQECLRLAQDFTNAYNLLVAELNSVELSQALRSFEQHCQHREAEHCELIAIHRKIWEERKRDADNQNKAALEEYRIQCQKTVEYNMEAERKYQERLESILRYNESQLADATSKWERDAGKVERKNLALIERIKGRWSAAVRRIERKNEFAIKQAQQKYYAAYGDIMKFNDRVRDEYEFGQLAKLEMLRCRKFLDVLLMHCGSNDCEWEQQASAFVILNSAAAAQAAHRFDWWSVAGWTEKQAATKLILMEQGLVTQIIARRSSLRLETESRHQNKTGERSDMTVRDENVKGDHQGFSLSSEASKNRRHAKILCEGLETRCINSYRSMFEAYTPHRPHSARSGQRRIEIASEPPHDSDIIKQSIPAFPRPPSGHRERSLHKHPGRTQRQLQALGGFQSRLSLWGVPYSASGIPPMIEQIATSVLLEEAEIQRCDNKVARLGPLESSHRADGTNPAVGQDVPETGRPSRFNSARREKQAIPSAVVAEALAAAFGSSHSMLSASHLPKLPVDLPFSINISD